MRTVSVRSTDPGTRAFLASGVAAVNFYVRTDVGGLTPRDIAAHVGEAHSEQVAKGTKTRYANQLFLFASLEPGDRIVTVDTSDSDFVFEGTVEDRYRFEPEPIIANHPHVIAVRWGARLRRDEIADQAKLGRVVTVVELDDPPTVREHVTPPTSLARRVTHRVEETSDCPFGRCSNHTLYRYTWPQQLSGDGEALLFVMKNPSCPDSVDNRTFANVLTRAKQLNASSIDVVNLFARRTGTDARDLNGLDFASAVGPDNDASIRRALDAADRVVVAWGASSGVRWYSRRVHEMVQLLAGRELWSVRSDSSSRHPLHPQVWSPRYELAPWVPE